MTGEPHIRRNVVHAVTWRMVAELLRRHHDKGLHVVETHPCQYDCVSLRVPADSNPLGGIAVADFHVPAMHFHVHEPFDDVRATPVDLGVEPRNAYVLAFLTADDPGTVLDRIDASLGLRTPTGPLGRTPASLAAQVLAGLLARWSLDRDQVEVRSGWLDGGYDVEARGWVEQTPGYGDIFRMPIEEQRRFAARLWRVARVGARSGIVFDFASGLMHRGRDSCDLASEARRIRDLAEIIGRADAWMRSA